MSKHIIFYDSECPFCHRAVNHIIGIDGEKLFRFAPFNGRTAAEVLSGPNRKYATMNSLVLVEDYQSTHRKFVVRSKATLRIFWLVGKKWRLYGCLSYLPGWTSDFFYQKLAEHRHQFKLKLPTTPGPLERFLP